MIRLNYDDIQDEKSYPDVAILQDIRSLIAGGETEGTFLDYKKDVSNKDNWPEAAAAFANSFGGLIIFGVDAPEGRARTMPGFSPKGTETKTRLVSTLLSHVQPAPEFRIRVVGHDVDKDKEIAVLRIPQGVHPPYMYSKKEQNRVYVRMGAQKTEADYLQLSALFERRRKLGSTVASSLEELAGPQSRLRVHDPVGSNQLSRSFYRLILAPDDDRAARRLTFDAERQFEKCISRTYDSSWQNRAAQRDRTATYLNRTASGPIEQHFALSSSGSIGFASPAGLSTGQGFFFYVTQFCSDFIKFLTLAGVFYQERQYYSGGLLDVEVALLDGARVHKGGEWLKGRRLFEPQLDSLPPALAMKTSLKVAVNPASAELFEGYIETALNDIARSYGSVFNPDCRLMMREYIDQRIDEARRPQT